MVQAHRRSVLRHGGGTLGEGAQDAGTLPNNRLQATAHSVRSYLAPAVCRA
jgi:hypothetical protein